MFCVGDMVRVKNEVIPPANKWMIELCGGKVFRIRQIGTGERYYLDIPNNFISNGHLLVWCVANFERVEQTLDLSGIDSLI